MTEKAVSIPLPLIDLDNQGYWEATQKHELRVQKCNSCGTLRFPPRPICHVCNSFDSEWILCSGKGTIHSYVVVPRPAHPAFRDKVPYGVVLVDLEEGVRLISNVVDVPSDQLSIGMPVEVVFDDVAEDVTLPRFKRSAG